MKRLLLIYIFIATVLIAFADEISFKCQGPNKVVQGRQFRLEYVVTGTDKGDISLPQFAGCSELYRGSSRGTNVSIINGNVSRTITNSITVTLRAEVEGTHTIEPAILTVDGKTYKTTPLTLTILKGDEPTSGGETSERGGVVSSSSKSETFIRLHLSRTTVFEQEAVLATFKVYTLAPQINFTKVSLPVFEGFVSQELDNSGSDQWEIERYNDRNYKTAVLRQVLLFPQRSGDLKIESVNCEVDVYEPRGRDFFGQTYYDAISKNIVSPTVTLHVKPLPQGRPTDYIGAVGEFTLKSQLSATEIKANEALTYKLILKGKGNLQLAQNPNIEFPSEFEAYDPKVNLNIRSATNGVTGERVIEYTIIPRYAGTFTLPSIALSYFDVKSQSYKTLSTPEYTVEVSQGDASTGGVSDFRNQDDVRLINADIRHIKTQAGHLAHVRTAYVDSPLYWLWYAVPVLLVLIYAIVVRIQAADNADVARSRNRKANKVALRRLKQAGIFLKAHNEAQFYEEVLRAVWGYLSDKLTIPISELSRDNIQAELARCGIDHALIIRFTQILDRCEFARYAPSQSDDAMEQLYQETIDAISQMENAIKNNQ